MLFLANLSFLVTGIAQPAIGWATLLLLLVFVTCNLSRSYISSPFSLILSWWTVLYILVPVTWVNFQAHSYTFGVSVGALPYDNEVYAGTVPIGPGLSDIHVVVSGGRHIGSAARCQAGETWLKAPPIYLPWCHAAVACCLPMADRQTMAGPDGIVERGSANGKPHKSSIV